MAKNREVVSLRFGQSKDLPQIAQAEQECFGKEAWDIDSLALMFASTGISFRLAFLDIAFAGWCVWDFHEKDARLMSIAVLPPLRRGKIGTKLLEDGLNLASKKGFQRVILEVRISNRPAQELYRSLGFVKVGNLPDWFQSPEEDGETWIKNL